MRASSASTFGSLVSTVTASATGCVARRASRAPSREPFDPGAQHRFATGGVEVEEVDAAPPEHPGRPPDGVRDVVQLEVGEDPEPLVLQGIEGGRAGLGVELEAHLGDAEPGLHALARPRARSSRSPTSSARAR